MKRRYKLLLVIFISFILAYIIYKVLFNKRIIYLSIKETNVTTYDYRDYINDRLKRNNYLYKNYTLDYLTLDNLLESFSDNRENINYYLKNASLITIDFSLGELSNYKELSNEIVVDYLNNFYKVLEHIRKLNNNDIYLILYYDDEFINKKVTKYCNRYNIKYISYKDLYKNIIKDKIDNKGNKKIADIILKNSNLY